MILETIFVISVPKGILWIFHGITSLKQFHKLPTRYVLVPKVTKYF